jgi:hypothetical protein
MFPLVNSAARVTEAAIPKILHTLILKIPHAFIPYSFRRVIKKFSYIPTFIFVLCTGYSFVADIDSIKPFISNIDAAFADDSHDVYGSEANGVGSISK